MYAWREGASAMIDPPRVGGKIVLHLFQPFPEPHHHICVRCEMHRDSAVHPYRDYVIRTEQTVRQ